MSLRAYLNNYIPKAEAFSQSYFATKKKQAERVDPIAVASLDILKNYMAGGKKIRGALTVLGYQLNGGKGFKEIIPISIAVEVFHSSLLIHDDFIDHDEVRRGKPTVHKLYAKGKNDHYGASMALVTADIGLFLSHQILSESKFLPEGIKRAIFEFDRLAVNTGYGELLDIAFDYKNDLTWDDVKKVRIYKTAHYTFVLPLTVGAILSGADNKKLAAIERYGEPVGLAFQIQDDILGVFGDAEVMGKSTESDIREGKRTFLYLKTIELSGKKEKDYLKKYYGSSRLTPQQINKIKKIMESSGAKDFCQEFAKDLVEKGKKNIPLLSRDKKSQRILSELADYMISRDK